MIYLSHSSNRNSHSYRESKSEKKLFTWAFLPESDLVLFSLEYKLERKRRCIFHFSPHTHHGCNRFLYKWCKHPSKRDDFSHFPPFSHLGLSVPSAHDPWSAAAPPSQSSTAFFIKELIKSCSQSANTFHTQRMLICSGILRIQCEGGLKKQLPLIWISGVIVTENWSLKWLHGWKQCLKTDINLQQRQGTLSLMKDQTYGVNVYLHVTRVMTYTPFRCSLNTQNCTKGTRFSMNDWQAKKRIEEEIRQILPGNPWER